MPTELNCKKHPDGYCKNMACTVCEHNENNDSNLNPLDSSGMRRCAACGKEKQTEKMKICMDSRQMHRYVCDTKCMTDFYV